MKNDQYNIAWTVLKEVINVPNICDDKIVVSLLGVFTCNDLLKCMIHLKK